MDEPAARRPDRAGDPTATSTSEAPAAADAPRPREGRGGAVVTVLLGLAVTGAAVVDAVRTWSLVAAPVVDPHAMAVASGRLIVVLLVAAAVLAVRLHGPLGWGCTALVLLAHPTAVLAAPASGRAALLQGLGPSWRVAVLGTGLVALMAVVLHRRVRVRDELEVAAQADAARGERLRREAAATRLAHAEATHELKGPLTVVRGAARLLATQGTALPPERVGQLRSALERGTQRLAARLAVMDRAAPMANGSASAGSARPASEVLASAAEHCAVDADASARLEVGAVLTSAPTEEVEHVLENLLSNARKYGDGDVRVRARCREDVIEVEVANRGGGLQPGDAARMFAPYWRAADAEDRAPGTGIGLAVVARLVTGWGGRVWAEVDADGTRVAFTLPAVAADRPPACAERRDVAARG